MLMSMVRSLNDDSDASWETGDLPGGVPPGGDCEERPGWPRIAAKQQAGRRRSGVYGTVESCTAVWVCSGASPFGGRSICGRDLEEYEGRAPTRLSDLARVAAASRQLNYRAAFHRRHLAFIRTRPRAVAVGGLQPWPFSIVPTVLAGMADPEGALRNTSDTSAFSDAKRIQDLLEAKLVKDEIAQREGGGGQKVSYIEAWRVIEKAQAIFGFDGWSSRVLDIQKEYEEQNSSTQRWSTGYSCLIRVSLKDGTFHDDVGFGSVVNERDRGKAIENARKEAVSDGVKRALRYYGAALGNCVYDKTHVRASLSLNSVCFSQHRTGALCVPMRAVLTSLSTRPTQVKVATARPKPAMPVPQLPPPPGGGSTTRGWRRRL